MKADERTAAVASAANTWGLNFISFALLIDIMYRGLFLDEAAWDLFVLLGLTGAVDKLWAIMAPARAVRRFCYGRI